MSLVSPVDVVPAAQLGKVHFIAIGGAGMSGIARIMLKRGIAVSGSDAKDSDLLGQLADLGAKVYVGHDSEHLGDADTVVVSTAIRESNPELTAARARGLRILHRSAALAALMADRRAVAVAGTHGKTTTTSMLTVTLQEAGLDPSYCIGGQLVTTGLGADEGTGDVFAAEADESDGSFLMYSPTIAVITNIEADHLDNYSGFDEVKSNFAKFVGRVVPGGVLVAGIDDPVVRELLESVKDLKVITYGVAEDADVRVENFAPRGLGSTFTLAIGASTGASTGPVSVALNVPGRHNALNSAAVIAVGLALDAPLEPMVAGLAKFGGARRRLELKGEAGGVEVFDSYAHHPTELTADLAATRGYLEGSDRQRIVAVFQPHLYSRTRFFATEFAQALSGADVAVVLDVYGAREDPEPGVSGELISSAIPAGPEVHYLPDFATAAARVAELARPGDIVITAGAGDVTTLGPEILALLS